MLDNLSQYFSLVTNFRTSNIMIKSVILDRNLPDLAAATSSQSLKLAISRFISENANAVVTTRTSRRGA